MTHNKLVERDHESQRAAWAASWFVSLLRARRTDDWTEIDRAAAGLDALGIEVSFEEDAPASGSASNVTNEEGSRG